MIQVLRVVHAAVSVVLCMSLFECFFVTADSKLGTLAL